MSTVSNEIFDEAFTSTELTNSINKRPYEPDDFGSQFEWTVTRSPTTTARINVTNGNAIHIAPYVARDGAPPEVRTGKRSALMVEIPGMAARASVMNREALNVTAGVTGEQRLQSLQLLRSQSETEIELALTRAERRQAVEAARGKLTNPAPAGGGESIEVLDLLETLSATRYSVECDTTDSKFDLNTFTEEMKEISESEIGGSAIIKGFKWINGREAHSILRNTKDYKDLLTNPTALYHAKVDGRKTVPINDNVDLVGYRYGYFQPDESYLFPIYDGHAQVIYGPHDSEEFWGTVLPRYVTSEPKPHGRGLDMEGWSFALRYFQHPGAIIKVNVIGPDSQ